MSESESKKNDFLSSDVGKPNSKIIEPGHIWKNKAFEEL